MAGKSVMILVGAWCPVVALALLVLAAPAHAGTNNWTKQISAECNGSQSIDALVACYDGVQSPGGDYCGNMHVASGPTLISGSTYAVYLAWDYDPTYPYSNCDTKVTSGYNANTRWNFTAACTSGNEWNEVYGGCVPICVTPQILSTQTGLCVVPKQTPSKNANGIVCKGNPCDVLSGNKVQREVDYAPASGVPSFVRTYNSHSYHEAKLGDFGSPLGAGWFGSYLQYVDAPSGLNSATVSAVRPGGDVAEFTSTLPGSTSTEYETEGESKERLVVALNGFGTFIGWRLFTAADDVELYNTNGRLVSIKLRGGVTQTLSYGTNSRVESVSNDFGHELTFQWDTATPPRVESVTLPGSSGQIEFTYGSDNNLTLVTYPDATTREYLYELTGSGQLNLLTGIEDEAEVRYATWGYGADWLVTSSEHAGGVDAYAITYNSNGNRTVLDPLGTSVTYTTDVIGGQRRYTGSNSQCESCGSEFASIAYDTAGNFESTTDFNGVETRYEHDVARTLETERTEAYGTANERTIETEWHSTFRLPAEITEPGRVTNFTYDSNGNVLTQTVTDTATSASRTWTMTYTSLGQLLTIDGPRSDVSDVTTFTYYVCSSGEECGQVHTVTDAANNVTTYNSYNAHGLPLSITDANGTAIALEYDLRQRLTSRTIGGEETQFDYWPTGLLEKITQPDGSFVLYGYDDAHRLTSVEDTAGNTITYTLNDAGQRLVEEVRDASNALTFRKTRVYDALGRLSDEIGEASQTTSFEYDDEGNLIEIEDPVGRITEQAYDELNRPASITDPAEQFTELMYDARDNLLEVIDPRVLSTTYVYNGFDEQVEQTSPDTGTSESPRDASGNVDETTDARNETGVYTYDALNRVTEIEYSDETIEFGYDQGTGGAGLLTSVTDGSGSTDWSHDASGRVTGRSQTTGSVTLDVDYGYDNYGRLETLTTPSGQIISYEYTDGLVTGLKVNGSYVLSSIEYQPFGPTKGWTWGNSETTARTYDTDGQLTEIDSAGVSTYTFYDDGLIETRSDDFASSLSWTSGTTTFDVASSSNRLESSTGQISRSYSYDAAGNTTGDGSRTFTYSDSGRMKTSTSGGVTTTYSYNGLGERVKKTNSSLTRYFAYDEGGQLVGEYDASGDLVQETVWLGDIPVATLRPNGGGISVFYIHTDHLNTPRRITRPSDDVIVWRWDSDPFGAQAANDDPDADSTTFAYNLRFPGQHFDTETGLQYNYLRDYDAVTGRYIQSDPIGLGDGLNTYAYVAGNPLASSDPLGLFQVDPASCAAHPRICKRIHQFAKKITRRQRQAFKDVTCATDEQIDLGLTPGYGPIVKLEDVANPLSPANFLARQMLLTIDPKKVGNADFMSEFEGGFYQVLGHEFAHYLDAVVTGNAAGSAREEGNEWEEKVYGKR